MADPAEETAPRGTTQEWVPIALRDVGGPSRPPAPPDRSQVVEYPPPPAPESGETAAFKLSSEANERVGRLATEVGRIAGEASRRVEGVESDLASAVIELTRRIDALEERLAAAGADPEPSDAPDINRVTYEDLRGLGVGISATQASRILAFRAERSGFRSLDQLDEIPGLTSAVRDGLREKVRVG